MATEEETSESTVKAASEKNEDATIAGKTVNNSVFDTENNVGLAEAPPPQSSINVSTVNAENHLGDNQYFFEDQVFFINKAGNVKFGLIIETCESYSGDEDDEEDEEKLGRGDVRVAWYPHGHEHIRSENTIGLADRTLMPGDVVRRMTADCSPQRGYVRDIKITADVKVLGLPYVIKNVSAERLRPLSIWQRDCTVCLDSWVGSAKDVDERAVLRGVNGVRFEIQSADFYHFKEAATSRRPSVFSPLIFFPGNIVIGRLPSTEKAKVLTPDIPLHLNRKGVMLKGRFVVESVRTEGVIVQWQCKALSKGSSKKISDLEPPKPYINADQLGRVKRLNVFESCVLQIADRSYLTYEPKDMLMCKSKWERELAIRYKEIFQQQQKIEGRNKIVTKTMKCVPKSTKLAASENSNVEKTTTTASKEKSDNDKNVLNTTTDGDWLDTTTTATTDTSDPSDIESECAEVNEEIIDRSDLDSIETTGDEATTAESVGHGNVKKSTTTKNVVKKSIASRNKHTTHSKSHLHSSKWQHKNSFCMPLSNMCSIPEGKELITETLLVYSTVSVVWQDGTVEHDIPSTHLYPIHHLDNHEFFPGDFTMLSHEDPNITFRDYGVIQAVDHQGRTAKVNWFKTYTSEDEPNFSPAYKGESEVSVYDLKDHPDFTYRPGGMVIRVSNFVGEDATCTAGQVLDNCIDGRVKVAWVDGHISSCWPQDLFDVGHHEQNDYVGDSDSWETQSENSGLAGDDEDELENQELTCAESDIVDNLERTHNAISRLEDILKASSLLHTRNVMRKLLLIYKTGRYIDRVMHTSFFHEDHFLELIERIIHEEPVLNATENTLLSQASKVLKDGLKLTWEALTKTIKKSDPTATNISSPIATCESQTQELNLEVETKPIEKVTSEETHLSSAALGNPNTPKVLLNVGLRIASNANNVPGSGGSKGANNGSATTPVRHLRNCSYTTHVLHVRNDATYTQMCGPDAPKSLYSLLPASELEKFMEEEHTQNKDNSGNSPTQPSSSQSDNYSAEKNHLLSSALLSIEKAFQVANSIKINVETLLSQDDSGTFSRNNSDASNNGVESDETPLEENRSENTQTKVITKKRKISSDFDVICHFEFTDQLPSCLFCVPFCTMLKEQLKKCKDEIERQCTRFTTYKSLVVPNNINNKSDTESNEITLITSDGEDQNQCQLESTTLSNGDESTQDIQLKNIATQIDVSSDLCAETWIVPDECFKILSNAPKNHKFYTSACEPSQPQHYFRAVQREHRLLKTSLPKGIWLRFYEDRIDLLSVMMEGPKKTPYENGLYFFDMQLDQDYPKRPPVCYYISYCVDRLNPNLYEEGKVCVSLLGTWSGRDVEVWGSNSTLLQVLVSIQGLILVPEPYFNEAGYEKQKGSLQGLENSRMYNEMVVIKVTQATIKMLSNPLSIFLEEILEYYKQNGLQMYERIRGWMELSKAQLKDATTKDKNQSSTGALFSEAEKLVFSEYVKPDFPLLPASRGFCLTLEGLLRTFKEKLEKAVLTKSDNGESSVNKLLTANNPTECNKVENIEDEPNQS